MLLWVIGIGLLLVGAWLQWGRPRWQRWQTQRRVRHIQAGIDRKLWREMYKVMALCPQQSEQLRMQVGYASAIEIAITITNIATQRWIEVRLGLHGDGVGATVSLGTEDGEPTRVRYPQLDKAFYGRLAQQMRHLWLLPEWRPGK